MEANREEAKRRHCEDLRLQYDIAFAKWSEAVDALHSYRAEPRPIRASVEQAYRRTVEAETAYQHRRNLLLRCMLG
jgi:hypothetical protein